MTLSFAEEIANPERYLPPAPQARTSSTSVQQGPRADGSGNIQDRVEAVVSYLDSRGFVFEPWQAAAFITAVRTKPFVILAGISGTGKTKLPRLIADATDAECEIVPVRPDWTDSSDLLGFERLDQTFLPGRLLRFAKRAQDEPNRQFFFVLDEMNIARVEYYLAEVLSRLEDRRLDSNGLVVSEPLLSQLISAVDEWDQVRLPSNLCIVGSVNMDETTFGFSRKVLDRAFAIEFSTVDLTAIGEVSQSVQPAQWTSAEWRPTALSLAAHPGRADSSVQQMIETLTQINSVLEQAQLQFGYRVRDEIVMFCLAAQQCLDSFTTTNAGTVDPLDIAIAMKILPRIQGSGGTIGSVLKGLQAWATPDASKTSDDPGTGDNTGFPFCAERLDLMARRLREFGYTSYWL